MAPRVYVIGVGMTKFFKPGSTDMDYPELAKEAALKALADAKVGFGDVKQVCVGYVYGDSTCGQRAVYEIGMTGVPVYNVNNNCATGATALMLAKQLIETGANDCTLALGFEKMEKGSLASKFMDRTNPLDKHVEVMMDIAGLDASPITAQMFGNAGKEHMEKYGTKPEHFAKIAHKNHKHSVNNPYSQFRDEYTLEQIERSPKVFFPLTKLQCCPTSDGAAAAVLASEDFVRKHGLEEQAVEVLGMEMATDPASSLADRSLMKIVGYDMTKVAAEKLFSRAPYSVRDVDVVELHDCFSANELITYEALGLCEPGGAGRLIDAGDNTYGGKYVVNPSGGLISKGHPLGATGLAQCAELCWQLRGLAGARQVRGARLALQHNIGLGGAAVVALYRLGFPQRGAQLAARPAAASSASSEEGFRVASFLKILGEVMAAEPALVEKYKGVYGFRVKKTDGVEGFWVIDARSSPGSVEFNGKTKPDVTLIVNDEDIVDLISGKINPQKAFFQGKLKMQGNIGLAMKLNTLLSVGNKVVNDLKSKL